jgi:peptidoglycan/LPS O-acetylase OafA/YrhL
VTLATRPLPQQVERRAIFLDAVRGGAAGLVFLQHVGSHSGIDPALIGPLAHAGQTGVAFFFVLSGFLLYRPFLGGPVIGRHYAVRRFLRIVPAYLFALVALSLITGRDDFWTHPWQYLLFAQNFDRELFHGFLGAAWTLQLEVTFYLLLPFLAWGISRVVVGSPLRHILVLGVIGAGGLLIGELIFSASEGMAHGREVVHVLNLFPLMFWMFISGMALAVFLETRERPIATGWRNATLATGLLLMLVALVIGIRYQDAVSVASAVLIVAAVEAVNPRAQWVVRLCASAGALSYAFYLWHRDLLGWLAGHGFAGAPAVAFGLVLALAAATLSYRIVEAPAMRLGRRLTSKSGRAGAPLAASAGAGPEPSSIA